MSTYESDPAGLGVGKRYGPRGVGGTIGEYIQSGTLREVVIEVVAGEPMSAALFTRSLPANYLIDDVLFEVNEAFNGTTPTIQWAIGGGTAATAETVAAVKAVDTYAGAPTNLSSTSALNFVLTPNAGAIASTTGKATVVVKYSVL